MNREKAKLILINFQIKNWSNKQINLIGNKVMPLNSKWGSIENDTIIKDSLKSGRKFILIDGIPRSAVEILNEVKYSLAKSVVKVIFDNEIISMRDLILETEVDKAKKHVKTGEVRIINCLDENKINTTEDLIKKLLESTNEVSIVNVTYSNNVEEYITNEGGETIEGFLKILIKDSKDNEDKELIKAFEFLDGAWDVVDVLNERVDEYIENN